MSAEFENFWNSPPHKSFVSALDGRPVRALRDILLLATLADDILTMQERAEVTVALGNASGLGDSLDFQTAAVVDHIDELYAEHEERGDELLHALLGKLGEEHREHALVCTLVLMLTHGLEESEKAFAKKLATLMEISDSRYDELVEHVTAMQDGS